MKKMFKKYFFPYFSFFHIWFMMLIPVGLLILPANYFDSGDSVCLSVLFFKTECWGCGITRATMHLLHLDYKDAYYYNMGSFVVLPALGLIWWGIVWRYYKYVRKEKTLLVSFLYKWKEEKAPKKKTICL